MRRLAKIRGGTAAPALLVTAVLLTGCAGVDIAEGGREVEGGQTGRMISQVRQNPGLVGESVMVAAEVREIVSDQAFTIGNEDPSVAPLLVLHRDGVAVQLGTTVEVEGVVGRDLGLADASAFIGGRYAYGDEPVTEARLRPYLGQTYLAATVVRDSEQ